mgnify:CR=1 FL=1
MIRQVLGPVLSGLADLVKAALPDVLAYKAGENEAQREQAKNAAKIKDRQLRIARRRRSSRGDILERMRRGNL